MVMAIYFILFFYWRVLFLFSDQKRLPVNNKKKNVRDTVGSVSRVPSGAALMTPQVKRKRRSKSSKKNWLLCGTRVIHCTFKQKFKKRKIKEEEKRVGSLAL
jgi:hypothetical protein